MSWCCSGSDSIGTVSNAVDVIEARKAGYAMKLAFQCVRTRWIPGFMPSAGARPDAGALARPVRPQGPYWPGIGWLAAGTSGVGLAKTPRCALSRLAAAAASVMACGDRG